MTRAALAALLCIAVLTGCTKGAHRNIKDSPFDPGVDYRQEGVDAVVVGNRLLAAQEYELAQDAFTRAAVTRGMTREIYAGIGAASLGLGQLTQAEDQLRKAVTFEDASPETWNNLGVVLMERGETSESVEVLRRAFALSNGKNDEIRDNLRLALALQDETVYDPELQEELDLVRSGNSVYRLKPQLP